MAKIVGSDSLWEAADDLVEMLGGRGYMENNIAPQIMRDCRMLRIGEGANELMTLSVGRRVYHSEKLHQFLESRLGCPEMSDRLREASQQIQQRCLSTAAPFGDRSAALSVGVQPGRPGRDQGGAAGGRAGDRPARPSASAAIAPSNGRASSSRRPWTRLSGASLRSRSCSVRPRPPRRSTAMSRRSATSSRRRPGSRKPSIPCCGATRSAGDTRSCRTCRETSNPEELVETAGPRRPAVPGRDHDRRAEAEAGRAASSPEARRRGCPEARNRPRSRCRRMVPNPLTLARALGRSRASAVILVVRFLHRSIRSTDR